MSQYEAKKQLELSKSDVLLLFFGGLRYSKGPDLLAKAMLQLDTSKRVSLVFAGQERYLSLTDIQKFNTNTSDNIDIHGHTKYIPESEVDLYFVAADALVLPYRRAKGISGPLRRACMAETHIIGSNNSDIGNIINEYKLGQTFKTGSHTSLANTISSFVRSEEDYPLPGVSTYAELCHWKSSGQELRSIYNEVLSEV